jgi:hypothetical protein
VALLMMFTTPMVAVAELQITCYVAATRLLMRFCSLVMRVYMIREVMTERVVETVSLSLMMLPFPVSLMMSMTHVDENSLKLLKLDDVVHAPISYHE